MDHRAATTIATLLLLGGAVAPAAAAQEDPVRLVGRVLFGTDSVAVEDATVTAPGSAPVRTNPLGHFVLDLAPGDRILTVELPPALGNRPFRERFRIPDAGIQLTWWVAPEVRTRLDAKGVLHRVGEDQEQPIAVPGVTVTATARRPERDRTAVRSDFLDRRAIEALGPGVQDVGDLTARMLGVHVVPSATGTLCIQARRGRRQHRVVSGDLGAERRLTGFQPDGCSDMVTVVVDGVMLSDAEHYVSSIRPSEIESIEFVGGIEATQRFGRRGRFGALVIQTRIR